jgi:hypothetical protein
MTEPECDRTFDGQHHYAPRKRLLRDAQGKTMDPNIREHWETVIACVCRRRPDDENLVKEQLAATIAERKRQAILSKRLTEKNQRQFSFLPPTPEAL